MSVQITYTFDRCKYEVNVGFLMTTLPVEWTVLAGNNKIKHWCATCQQQERGRNRAIEPSMIVFGSNTFKHNPKAAKEALNKLWQEVKEETRSVSKNTTLTATLGKASLAVAMMLMATWSLAVTVPTRTTNTVEVTWLDTNGQVFYRLVQGPPLPDATNQASVASRETVPLKVKESPFTLEVTTNSISPNAFAATNSAIIVAVDQIATHVTATNWTDFPPAGTAPLTTTLADTTQGIEYGTIVTNKVVQVLEGGVVRPLVVSSTTNTIDVLTRVYQFKRVHDPASIKRLRKHPINVR